MSDVDDGLGWLGDRGRDGGIDRVPLPVPHGGLSLCGKHAIGPDPGRALRRSGADTVVCLVEEHELGDRYPEYVGWLRLNAGASAIWFPVQDLHAPPLAVMRSLLDEMVRRILAGEHLLVHCAAGIGRAGTVGVCLLMELGMTRDDALAHIAAHRPMAGPEVGAQRTLVDHLAALRA